jgi:hypothetical protein
MGFAAADGGGGEGGEEEGEGGGFGDGGGVEDAGGGGERDVGGEVETEGGGVAEVEAGAFAGNGGEDFGNADILLLAGDGEGTVEDDEAGGIGGEARGVPAGKAWRSDSGRVIGRAPTGNDFRKGTLSEEKDRLDIAVAFAGGGGNAIAAIDGEGEGDFGDGGRGGTGDEDVEGIVHLGIGAAIAALVSTGAEGCTTEGDADGGAGVVRNRQCVCGGGVGNGRRSQARIGWDIQLGVGGERFIGGVANGVGGCSRAARNAIAAATTAGEKPGTGDGSGISVVSVLNTAGLRTGTGMNKKGIGLT